MFAHQSENGYNFAGGKKEKNSETTCEITKEKKKSMARVRSNVFRRGSIRFFSILLSCLQWAIWVFSTSNQKPLSFNLKTGLEAFVLLRGAEKLIER